MTVQVTQLKCQRCGYTWMPKNYQVMPKVCPRCKSMNWDRPRIETEPENLPALERKAVETYLSFCREVDPSRVRAIQKIIENEILLAQGSARKSASKPD